MKDHIAVLDPGTRVPELDCFNRMARTSSLPLTYHLPAMQGLDSVHRTTDGLAAVIVLGSGASVNDDLPWQDALRTWTEAQIADGLPVLGLCYGHQLLAQILGGAVGLLHADGTKERGLREVSLDADALWGEACRGSLVVSHREVVTGCPPHCHVVGASTLVAIEAFAHDTLPVWGIQAHPEATMAFLFNNAIPSIGVEGQLAFGHGLVDRFLRRAAW